MDEVSLRNKEVILTKRGKPVVKLIQYREKPAPLFGIAKVESESLVDIATPIDDIDWGGGSYNPDHKQ